MRDPGFTRWADLRRCLFAAATRATNHQRECYHHRFKSWHVYRLGDLYLAWRNTDLAGNIHCGTACNAYRHSYTCDNGFQWCYRPNRSAAANNCCHQHGWWYPYMARECCNGNGWRVACNYSGERYAGFTLVCDDYGYGDTVGRTYCRYLHW